jgi:hypothetical protein
MSAADRDKRQNAQQDKKSKLTNPLFFVSSARLSIRNLAKTASEQELKDICAKAVEAGMRRKCVTDADLKAHSDAQVRNTHGKSNNQPLTNT